MGHQAALESRPAPPPRSGFPGAASTCLHGHCLLSGVRDIHKAGTVVPIRWSGNEQSRRWTQIMNARSSGPLHLVLLLCGTLLPPVLFLAHFLTCHEASRGTQHSHESPRALSKTLGLTEPQFCRLEMTPTRVCLLCASVWPLPTAVPATHTCYLSLHLVVSVCPFFFLSSEAPSLAALLQGWISFLQHEASYSTRSVKAR